jgi:hypothetical protein
MKCKNKIIRKWYIWKGNEAGTILLLDLTDKITFQKSDKNSD